MIRLTTTTQTLEIVLSGAVTTNELPVVVSYSDKTTTSYNGGTQLANTNGTTPVTICAAPGASTVRDIDFITVKNADTVAASITISFDNNGTGYELVSLDLAAGDQAIYVHGSGWQVVNSDGELKTSGSGAGGGSSGETTDFNLGTVSSGTITPNPSDSYTQTVVNGGAFTLAATAQTGRLLLLLTNNASAGAVTFSGFDKEIDGDTIGTTVNNRYAIFIWSVGGSKFYEVKTIFSSPSITFTDSDGSASDLTTYTFTSKSIGTENPTRKVIVSVSSIADALGSTSISSLTVGGISATVAVSQVSGDGGFCGLAIADVPTGTTASVVVTMANLQSRMGIGVWAAYDLTSSTPTDTATSTADPASLNLDLVAGDIAVAAVFNNTNGTATWTGATERFDAIIDGAQYSGADFSAVSDEAPRTIECDYSATSRDVGVSAAWR